MSDKDLLVVISEMLRRQDQHSEIVSGHTKILNRQTEILNDHTEILSDHTRIMNSQTAALLSISDTLNKYLETSHEQFSKQSGFNDLFLDRLNSIEKLLVRVIDMDERIKRLEAAVFK